MNDSKIGCHIVLIMLVLLATWPLMASPFSLPDSTVIYHFAADSLNCQTKVEIPLPFANSCAGDSAYWELTIDMDIRDIDADSCISFLDFQVDIEANDAYLMDFDTGIAFSGRFPLGKHALRWRANNCLEIMDHLIQFTVDDITPPQLNCRPFISVDTYPVLPGTDADGDGDEDFGVWFIELEDLLLAPIYDCTGDGALAATGLREVWQYSINIAEDPVDSLRNHLLWTCDESVPNELQVRAWDQAGNFSQCSIPCRAIDTREYCGHCHPITKLRGWIRTEEGVGVPGVGGRMGEFQWNSITWLDGYYSFCGQYGEPVNLSFYKEDNYLEGISTADMIQLRRHVLSIDSLKSPYKYLAADVNNDQRITTLDIVELHRLILGIQDRFHHNSSWRFVPSQYVFPDPCNPWLENFPTSFEFSPYNFGVYGNFTAIKIGDLNGTAPVLQ